MKYLLFLAMPAILLSASACNKKSKYKHSGYVEGIDSSKNCTCCIGYLVKVDGDNTTYRATSLPTLTPITSATHFPVRVDFNYALGDKCGTNQYIDVSGMIITY